MRLGWVALLVVHALSSGARRLPGAPRQGRRPGAVARSAIKALRGGPTPGRPRQQVGRRSRPAARRPGATATHAVVVHDARDHRRETQHHEHDAEGGAESGRPPPGPCGGLLLWRMKTMVAAMAPGP